MNNLKYQLYKNKKKTSGQYLFSAGINQEVFPLTDLWLNSYEKPIYGWFNYFFN
jgi:hypothetical protein